MAIRVILLPWNTVKRDVAMKQEWKKLKEQKKSWKREMNPDGDISFFVRVPKTLQYTDPVGILKALCKFAFEKQAESLILFGHRQKHAAAQVGKVCSKLIKIIDEENMKEIIQIPSEHKSNSEVANKYIKQLQKNETLEMENDEESVLESDSTVKTVGFQTNVPSKSADEWEQTRLLKKLYVGGKQIHLVEGDFTNAQKDVQVNPSNRKGKLGAGISGVLAHRYNPELQLKMDEEVVLRGEFKEGIVRATTLSHGTMIIHVVSLNNSGQQYGIMEETEVNQANMEGILRHSIQVRFRKKIGLGNLPHIKKELLSIIFLKHKKVKRNKA
ncbi:uncharacterized protein LOC119967918 [Scyliorhinus canicula]|uniref:uncharacterized protein LOC119967918 n=1 Tax=Scyliorhinus canicula TaxID=7830 RepID=UPI0018F4F9CF|nr:uncharacterized protein LOC119967918 [Scyliorhinus canicula]